MEKEVKALHSESEGTHSAFGKPKRDGTIFIGQVDPSRHHVKILIWQL